MLNASEEPRSGTGLEFRDDDNRSHAKPSDEQIAILAYVYWEERQGRDGSAEDDWLRAERDLSQMAARTAHA